MASSKRPSRRRVLQSAAVFGLGGLAGCGGDGGDGGDDTPAGGDPTEEPTATATPEPEPYSATAGGVGTDVGIVPFIHAHTTMLPEATDGQFTGEYQQFSSGRLSLQSVVSNSTELYTGGLGAVLQAFAAGSDLRIIFPLQTGTDYILGVREDIGGLEPFAESGNDLEFGISSIGGLSHTMAVGGFLDDDLPVENVNFVEVGGSSDRTAALGSGAVDGTPIHRDQFERLNSEDAGVAAAKDLSSVYPNFIQAVLTGRQRELENNPQYYQELCNQIAIANQNTMEDFDWTFNRLQQYQAEPLSREEARPSWEVNQELGAWPTEPIGTEPYQAVADMMREGGILDVSEDDLNIDELVTDEFSSTAFENL